MKINQYLLYLLLFLVVFNYGVLADTQWIDMVSPINHSQWKNIAVGDLDTDGIPDIVAANPDPNEQFSDYSGLPVWLGQIYSGSQAPFYWGLSRGYEISGTSVSMPLPDPKNTASPHVSCVFIGNTCNLMGEWTMEIAEKARINQLYVVSGGSDFNAAIPSGVFWPDIYHLDYDTWKFTQIESGNSFKVFSERYGQQSNNLTLGVPYTSDRGQIEILVTRKTKGNAQDPEIFHIVTQPALANVYTIDRISYPERRYLTDNTGNTLIRPSAIFVDRSSLMQLRYDPKPFDEPLTKGQKWYFHTPHGPKTNEAYNSVKLFDVNRDGQLDIVAAGPNGIDIFLQTGPAMSDWGFQPINPRNGVPNNGFVAYLGVGENENNHVYPNVVRDDVWVAEYKDGFFSAYGLFTHASGPRFLPYEQTSTYCRELTIKSITGGPFINGDKFYFSVKRVNWDIRSGPDTSADYTDILVDDITRNGYADIIASKATGGFDYFSFNGTNWIKKEGITFGNVVTSMLLKDVDNDGWLDLIASSNRGVHVWRKLPGGGWDRDTGPAQDRSFLGVTAADFNKDGFMDIAATEDLGGDVGAIQVWYFDSEKGWFQRSRASVPTPDPNNVGNGFMSVVKVSHILTIPEIWTLTCDVEMANSGLFRVTGSRSGIQSKMARVGEAYISDRGQVEFTIFDGLVDYAVNDKFTFRTGRGPLELRKFGAIAASDLNKDGNMDIFATSLNNFGIGIWLGNGHYGWLAETPPESSSSWQTLSADVDLNFDGHPDIVAGSYSPGGGIQNGIKIWVGKHSSPNVWKDWIYKPIINGRFNKIVHADFNNDGNLDIALTSDDPSNEGIWLLTGNGQGDFEKITTPISDDTNYFSICAGDFNQDGLCDIAAGKKGEGFDVFLNGPDFSWSNNTSSIMVGEIYDITAADIDRDGHLDLIIAQNYISSDRPGVIVYFNDGKGNFSDSQSMPLSATVYSHWSVDAIDLDNNGILDIITTNASGNPGTFIFYGFLDDDDRLNYNSYTIIVDPQGHDHNYGLAVADFNLDAQKEFATGSDGHGGLGFVGFGSHFEECNFMWTTLGFGKIRDIAVADITNNGYPDIVISTEQNGVQAYKTVPGFPGQHSFSFAPLKHPAGTGDYVGITAADFTNDGLIDVIASRNQSSGASGLDMWISYRDFSLPRITNTYPKNNTTFNVGADTDVYVSFSKTMDPSTLTYENIQITKDGNPIGYSIVTLDSNHTIRITASEMVRHAQYTVTIVGGFEGVRDQNGNMFDGNQDGQAQESPYDDYVFSFITIDTIPPSVPTGLLATPGDAEVSLRWLPNNHPILDSDLEGYYVVWQVADHSEPENYKFYSKEELGVPPRITIRGVKNLVELELSVVSRDFDYNESLYSERVRVLPYPERPQIWWGGTYDTLVTSNEGGYMTLLAFVVDPKGTIQNVELYYEDMPTGAYLIDGGHPDFPSGLGLYALHGRVDPLHTGYLEIPFQMVAHSTSGLKSAMWPYLHMQRDIPGSGGSTASPRPGSLERYFALKHQQFIRQTEIPFERQRPSTSPDRPQILCAGFTANPEADFEFGARNWLTAIVVDPNDGDGYSDIQTVELIYRNERYPLVNTGIANFGFADELELTPVIWGIDLTWYGEETDPEGPNGRQHYLEGPQLMKIQAVDYDGNASDIWPYFIVN
ncbi:MAG: FG-GAP-like repeat-containing protein [bacterium]